MPTKKASRSPASADIHSEQGEYATASRRYSDSKSPSRPRRAVPAWMAATSSLALAGVLIFGPGIWGSDPIPASPGNNSAAAGFARDMQVHQAQAVEMSFLIRERSDDSEIRALAYEIATNQQHQIGQMDAWLRAWKVNDAPPGPPRTWMDGASTGPSTANADPHAGTIEFDGQLPGMASREQFERLDQAEGRRAEALFLELMVTHHKASLEMARSVLELSDDADVTYLARSLIESRTAEIQVMEQLLLTRSS